MRWRSPSRAPVDERPALGLGVLEVLEQDRGVGVLEVEAGIFLLGLPEDVAVGHALFAVAAVEVEVVDVLDALHVHGEALEAVGQLARDRRAFEPRDLLEVGELRHLHPVAPALPARGPRRRASGSPSRPRRSARRAAPCRSRSRGASRGTGLAGSRARASGSPGTGSSAAAGWGSRRSVRPSAGARAAT